MPILSPTGIQFQISDLATGVIRKVENRVGDVNTAYIWIRDALLEIAGNTDYRDEFSELEILGPLFNLTGSTTAASSTQEYDESNIIPSGDVNVATLDILIWRDPPGNSVRQKLNPSHYQEVDKSQISPGVPTSWYRFGGSIGFQPTPDKNYQVQARILRMHPIADAAIQQTVILLPRDWNEIIEWAAAERGFMEMQEFEKAGGIHTFLYGDPKHPDKPGLISGRKKKRGQEAHRTSGRLRPIVGTYINK